MAISMRNVAGNRVPFKDLAFSGSMPHKNNYGCLNMHAIGIVCISKDSQSQWQYSDIEIRVIACTLWDIWTLP